MTHKAHAKNTANWTSSGLTVKLWMLSHLHSNELLHIRTLQGKDTFFKPATCLLIPEETHTHTHTQIYKYPQQNLLAMGIFRGYALSECLLLPLLESLKSSRHVTVLAHEAFSPCPLQSHCSGWLNATTHPAKCAQTSQDTVCRRQARQYITMAVKRHTVL